MSRLIDKSIPLLIAAVLVPIAVVLWFAWRWEQGVMQECRDRGGISVQTGFNQWACIDDDVVLEDRP